jgi:pimeloyl-ACP methyl ester carboxylesterase
VELHGYRLRRRCDDQSSEPPPDRVDAAGYTPARWEANDLAVVDELPWFSGPELPWSDWAMRPSDRAARRGDEATPMEVRHEGGSAPVTAPELAARFPDASERVVVFLHGLGETEHAWRLGADADRGADTYGARFGRDLGHTPLYLRYNSGLHISTNGRALSALLAELVEAWAVEVAEVVLVGHSMGGLVARSACQAALDDRARWVELIPPRLLPRLAAYRRRSREGCERRRVAARPPVRDAAVRARALNARSV